MVGPGPGCGERLAQLVDLLVPVNESVCPCGQLVRPRFRPRWYRRRNGEDAYLGRDEPRSAAEITSSLEQQYPERAAKTTVVRTTLEGLVAKSQAQRTRQGSSVFCSAPDAAEPGERNLQQPV